MLMGRSGRVADERREWRRYPAHLDVELTIKVGDRDRRCLVRDISLGGARLYCPDDLPDTPEITLQHPLTGQVSAERLWHADREVGIRFDFSEAALTLIASPPIMASTPAPPRGVVHPAPR